MSYLWLLLDARVKRVDKLPNTLVFLKRWWWRRWKKVDKVMCKKLKLICYIWSILEIFFKVSCFRHFKTLKSLPTFSCLRENPSENLPNLIFVSLLHDYRKIIFDIITQKKNEVEEEVFRFWKYLKFILVTSLS